MTLLIRIVNAFYAALFLIAALVAWGSLRAPGWAGLATLLALLCLVNLRAASGPRRPALAAANAAALLLTGAGLLAGEPALRWIGGLSLVPFAVTGLALVLRVRPA